MSTLKTLLSERKAADTAGGPPTVATTAPSPTLVILKWDSQSWVLPWSYFLGAHHKTVGSDECLTLSFSLCEVIVQGKRLDLLLPDIAAYRLESLRELPDKYRHGPASAPSIREIGITPHGQDR